MKGGGAMSDFVTMILVLGGTLVVAMGLLYLSLLPGRPPSRMSRRRTAEETAAAMVATSDSDPPPQS
jgi:cytochrome c biogenesis protein CcdA